MKEIRGKKDVLKYKEHIDRRKIHKEKDKFINEKIRAHKKCACCGLNVEKGKEYLFKFYLPGEYKPSLGDMISNDTKLSTIKEKVEEIIEKSELFASNCKRRMKNTELDPLEADIIKDSLMQMRNPPLPDINIDLSMDMSL